VDLLESRALPALSDYVMRERSAEADCPCMFLVGGRDKRWCEPLSYDAVVRMFARAAKWAGARDAWLTPHSLRTQRSFEAGTRELTLMTRQTDTAMPPTRIGPTRLGNVVASRRQRGVPAHQARIQHPGGSRVPGPGQSGASPAEGR
jgi:hypothetical protein